jgi:PTH1 family peptidyl-tRNA hydrolase
VKLIVGLGNPGKEYTYSRHNIGFMVINRLAKAHDIALQKKSFKSRWETGKISRHKVILAKPHTFMNLSGEAVNAFSRFYKIVPKDIIVIHDDLDINFGSLKVKTKGGSGGHRGITSIITHLHEGNFVRVRVGVGRPFFDLDPSDFVLQPFSETEKKELKEVITQAQNCVEFILSRGPEKAMNMFHSGKTKDSAPG